MSPVLPLLAALDVFLIKAVVVIIVFILAGIAQLMAKLQQIKPPAGRPARPVPPDVAAEIDEFMRRTASRRNVPAAPPTPASPPSPTQPVRVEAATEPPVGGQVEEHVKKYLDVQAFSRRSEELGEEVAQQVDREIDQHLHQVFDHRVSQLELVGGEAAAPPAATFEASDTTEDAAAESTPVAVGVLDLIGNPESLRQAIILNEILQRPEARWG